MKNIFTSFCFLFFLLAAEQSFPQAPNWLWAIAQSGGSCYTSAYGLGVDRNTGDIFVGGRVVSGLTLGGTSTTGSGVWSARLNSAGVAQWVVTHSFPNSGSANYMYGFSIDDSDNSYAAGLINSGGGWYADKYDANGNQRWAVSLSGASPYGIAGDKAGNAYITGEFTGTQNFGNGVIITENGGGDLFIAKYDNWGNCVWAKNYGGPGYDAGRGIQIDNAGNICVVGSYSASATFGNITPPTPPSGGTTRNFMVMKLDTAGNPLWVAPATNAGLTDGALYWNYAAMGVDSCGNIYASGHFINTAQFGNLPTITSAGGRDIFIAKCLDNGKWEWVKSAGGAGTDEGQGFAFDRNNDVYLTGYFSGTANFGTQSFTTSATNNLFIAKYANSSGDLQWVQMGGGSIAASGQNLAVDNAGYVYAIGGVNSSGATFGSNTIASGTANASCGQNILIVKLDTTPPLNIIPHPNPSYCAGSTTKLPFTITGNFNGSNTFTAELSDSSGSFVSADTLGTFNSISAGQINISIPASVTPGSKYVIRIVSSNPATSSRYYCNSYTTSPVQTTYATVTISSGDSLKVTNDTTACAGNPVQLNVSGGSDYTWDPAAGLSCNTCANPVASPTSSQTYTVTANGSSACAASASILINVLPGINLVTNPAGDTTICSGKSVQLAVSGAATYVWFSVSSLNCTTCTSLLVTPTADTTAYIITGTSADKMCSNSKQINIYLGNSAMGGDVTAPRDTICQGTPGRLTLTNYLGTPIQWQSSTDDINFTDINNADTTDYKTSPLSQTTWFRAIVGSGTCISTSDTLELFVPPALLSKFNYIASNLVVTFNSDSSSGNIVTYSWNFGDNSTTSSEANPVHTFPKDTTYYVCLTLYDGSNCSYTFCRYISGLDGINTVNAAGNMNIYPNPFTNQLSMGNPRGYPIYRVEIYDVLGRMAEHWTTPGINGNTVVLDVSSLPKGMYFVKIQTEKTNYIQKIVKE